MKVFAALIFILFSASFSFAQQNKWMKDEQNILTVTIDENATKKELLDLKEKLWSGYQIKFDCPRMDISKRTKKLKYLSLRVEMPTGEVGTVGTSFAAPGQVIGFHFDRNPETYDEFGVWSK
ncbi:MAG: hypothetical protein GC192_06010 [Bacteroidetes bacterium]|nr:hypothetical protein [Bacteroidota bacterium]